MTTLLLAPHADDETLFAAYLAQQHAAHVLVIYDEGREIELRHATQWLGCTFEQWRIPKGADELDIAVALLELEGLFERVIAPAEEVGGHEDHNIVARAAERLGVDIRYSTYAPRGQRSQGVPSPPERPEFIARKLAAMSCYRSQIQHPATRPWFFELLDMREWTAA